MTDFHPVRSLAYAFGKPSATGLIRQAPEDFRVDEIPGFEPDGKGDHVYLRIEKTGLNTSDVVNRLRKFCAVHNKDIGFAGLKDRHAITSQVFSINMAGKVEPDWSSFEDDKIQVLKVSRHPRKLKRGVLKGNRFQLRITDLIGDQGRLDQCLQEITQRGVPNYFGSQRFGRDGDNADQALRLFQGDIKKPGRQQKSILLSAARSLVFNAVLSKRVELNNWDQLLPGEVIGLDGTERHFVEDISETLVERAARLDVHPTGPLPGLPSRALKPTLEVAQIENLIEDQFEDWISGLKQFKVDEARRPLRLAVRNLDWQFGADELFLSFDLTSGAYATAVLRELVETDSNQS